MARANDTLLPQSRSRLTASVSRKRSVRPSRSPANAAAATAKPYRHVHPMAIAPSAPFRASLPKYRNASHCPATAISATNTQSGQNNRASFHQSRAIMGVGLPSTD